MMLTSLLLSVAAQASPAIPAATVTPVRSECVATDVGREPAAFAAMVGTWRCDMDGDNAVLAVDGRKWKEGQSAARVADKARALYGERYAEFLDNVTAFAYFPYAVARNVTDFTSGEITLRFKPLEGRIDQAAGIVFDVKPNGDYLTLRGNALENNLVLFQFKKGKRSPVKWIKNTPTSTKTWHDLKLKVTGKKVEGFLDGKLLLEHELAAPVSGKVGVWSKADSFVYIDDFTVTPAP
jgi:hypothetical protein